MKDKPKVTNQNNHRGIINFLLLIFAGISLFFAQSGLWVNNVIFDQQTFTTTTNEVILSQSSRDAISQTIMNKAFENRPVADRIIGDRAANFVSNLLGSDISEKALTRISSASYAYLTSPNRQDIAIDLSSIREPISGIVSFAENQGREVRFDPQAIPESITLVESDELPDIASYIRIMLIASFLFWLAVVILCSTYMYINRKNIPRAIYMVGSMIIIISIVSLSTGPFVPPVISSFVSNIQLRGIVSDLTIAYIKPFISQMYLTIFLASIAMLATRFRWIFVSSWNAVYTSINHKLSKRA